MKTIVISLLLTSFGGDMQVHRDLHVATKGLDVFRRAGCATCHAAAGGGRLLGPDLSKSLSEKPLDELVQSLIHPSAKIEERYRTHVVVTADGQVLQGFLAEQTDKGVMLLDGDRTLRITRQEIERMNVSNRSVMPQGLLSRLSWNEMRDLLAFLKPLRPTE